MYEAYEVPFSYISLFPWRCVPHFLCFSFWLKLKSSFSFVSRFEDYFSNRVKQLTFTFPEDAATSMGAPFWSAPKRFPRALHFSAADPSHLNFIMAASILRAESNGVAIPEWAKNTTKLADVVKKIAVPTFEPKKGVNIVTDEKASNLSSTSVDDVAVIDDLLAKLQEYAKRLPPGFQMKPIQFEKVII
jgi:ubiquitin-activating enzyme E1